MTGVKKESRFIALGVIMVAATTLAILKLHYPSLAFSYRDGVDAISMAKYSHDMGFFIGFPFVNIQILGGVYALNYWLSPSIWPVALFGTAQSMLDLSYVLCAAELYLSAYGLVRTLGGTKTTAAASGLLLPLLTLPLVWPANPFNIMTFSPVMGDLIVLNNLILLGLVRILAPDGGRPWAYALFAAAVTWLVLLAPLSPPLAIPFDLAVYLVLSARLAGHATFWKRQVLLVAIAAILAVLFGPFMVGLFTDTSSALFASELTGDVFTNPWNQLPVPFKTISNALATLALLGIFWLAHRMQPADEAQDGLSRAVLRIGGVFGALALVLSAFFVFVAGGSATFPRPAYFEIVAWPLYFMGIAFAGNVFWKRLAPQFPIAGGRLRAPYLLFAAFFAVAMAWAVIAPQRYASQIMPYRPARDAVVAFLQEKLTRPDGTFAGEVATFAGTSTNIGDVLAYDRSVERAVGNAHRGETLRYFGLHTLDEYNSLITPGKFLMLTRFFARPTDDQSRAMTVFTEPDQKALAALGVRYVISDRALPAPAAPRLSQDIPGIGRHIVYELPDVNLGTYSPVQVRPITPAEQQLRAILERDFDFRRTVVTAAALPPLLPAHGSLAAIPGAYHVQASSAGTSLLLLPVAYSHCMRWVNGNANAHAPRLLRVDFGLTGLLFDRTMSGEIRPVFSPFADPFCLIADRRDMQTLKDSHRTLWPRARQQSRRNDISGPG